MGGNRAKERRRLKREEGTSNVYEGRTAATDGRTAPTSQGRPPQSPPNNRQQQQRQGLRETKQPSNNVPKSSFPHRPPSSHAVATQSERPKKKVKKPKHLKRKIENLTDSKEKDALRKSMEEWERQKEEMRRLNKKQKKDDPPQEKETQDAVPKVEEETREAAPPVEERTISSTFQDDAVDMGDTVVTTVSKVNGDKDIDTTPLANSNCNNLKRSSIQQSAAATIAETDRQEERAKHSDDDDDSSVEDMNKKSQRQRGKRRRGRKDTSKKIGESATVDPTPDASKRVEEATEADIAEEGVDAETITESMKDDSRPRKKTDRSRYCVGRKPVTDFIVGQTYDGKVVYVKPFGVFLDIGCHSDAFCHISRVRDDFVKDPTALFNEGDKVQARVVEIDRRQKRITVSMQSEAMIEMERKSIETRKERSQKQNKKMNKAIVAEPKLHSTKETVDVSDTVERSPVKTNQNKAIAFETKPKIPKDPAGQSHAELKRQRKLARRAERRMQQVIPETATPNSH